jgi:uncharacterized membrane protein
MNTNQLNIWHVGNWCIHIGQKYVESPFEAPSKDVEVLNYARPFVSALREISGSDVISQPSWELYHMSPEEFDERLEWADTIIFGDVETKCLMLHPDFFNRSKWQDRYVTFPDRFDLLHEWIEKGGHFHMNGGWQSFSGEQGKGGWGRSRLKSALPAAMYASAYCALQPSAVNASHGRLDTDGPFRSVSLYSGAPYHENATRRRGQFPAKSVHDRAGQCGW